MIYNLADAQTASAKIYTVDGKELCEINAVRTGKAIHVTYTKTTAQFRITIHNGPTAVAKPGTTELEIRL